MGLSGHPSASAIGWGIAITSGLCTREGRSAGMGLGRSSVAESCSTSTAHDVDAGVHTSGLGPSSDSSQPRASAVAAAPLALLTTDIHTHWPSTSGPLWLYVLASSVRRAAFSLDAAVVTVVQSLGAATGASPAGVGLGGRFVARAAGEEPDDEDQQQPEQGGYDQRHS